MITTVRGTHYSYIVEDYEYEVSFELDNDVILDIDKEEKHVAFEFLNVSKIFNLDKSYFSNLSNSYPIQYSEETINKSSLNRSRSQQNTNIWNEQNCN